MLRAGLWSFIGKGGGQLINIALIFVLARLLTPEAFGIVAAAQAILSLSQLVARIGMGAALIQAKQLTRDIERTACTIMLGVAAILAGVLYSLIPWLAKIMNTPELETLTFALIATLVISASTSPGMSLLMREMKFKTLAVIDVATFGIFYSIMAIALALAGWSYWAIILANLSGAILRAVAIWCMRPVWPTLNPRLENINKLFSFGGGVFLIELAANFAQRIDKIIVGSYFGASSLGLYSRAYNIIELPNSLFGSTFRDVLFTGLSQAKRDSKAGREQTEETFLLAHSLAAFLVLPVSVICVVLSDEVIAVLLGKQWPAAAPILQVLSLGAYFRLAYKVSHSINLAEGRVYSSAWRVFVYSLLVCGAGVVGAQFSLVTAGFGILLSLFGNFVLLTQLSLSILAIPPVVLVSRIVPFAISGCVSAAVGGGLVAYLRSCGVIDWAVFLLTSFAIVMSYSVAIFFLRGSVGVRRLTAVLGQKLSERRGGWKL